MVSYLKIAKGFAEQKVVCYYCQFLWQSSNFQPPNMLKLDNLCLDLFFNKNVQMDFLWSAVDTTVFYPLPTPVFFSLLPYQIFFFRGKPFMEKREHKQKMEGREGARGSGASESESSFEKKSFLVSLPPLSPFPFHFENPHERFHCVLQRRGGGKFLPPNLAVPRVAPSKRSSALFACILCFTSLKYIF